MNFRLLLGPKEWGIFLSFLGEGAKDDEVLLQLQQPTNFSSYRHYIFYSTTNKTEI